MPFPNPLNKYALYNCLWSMAAVSPGDFNNGAYRKELTNVIFSSAGRFEGKRVSTVYGVPEFFVDNIEMETFTTPTGPAGNTNQVKITMDIFEPYSMGLFLQSMQVSARNAGYQSYLDNAPYVLKLDIVGQTTIGDFSEEGPWYFCVGMRQCTFTTNESGTTYKLETYPYGDRAFNGSENTLDNELKLIGKGASEALITHPDNSFIIMMNEREKRLVKDKRKLIPNKFSVEFPPCDWGGPNPFENDLDGGSFEFQPDSPGGTETQGRAGDSYEEAKAKVLRDKVKINPRERSLQISKDTSLTTLIDAVIINTKQARRSATGEHPLDPEGMILWWRTDVDIKLLDFDESTKERAKEYIFRVVPFKIHHSVFMGPNARAQGIEVLKESIAKEYYYIYTGLNTEVKKWSIEIKNTFYTAVDPNKPEKTGVAANPGVQRSVAGQPLQAEKPAGALNQTDPENSPAAIRFSKYVGNLPFKAGSGRYDTEHKVATEFYYNILNHTFDMVNLDLETMGDPYWLPEQGQPNYHPPGGGSMTASNGTMNYETKDILISMIFKTPLDTFGGDGVYRFQDGEERSPFSGIYRVTKVINKWNGGEFSQKLEGYRIPAQEIEGNGDRQPTQIGPPLPPISALVG
jgi:hypothetical protein